MTKDELVAKLRDAGFEIRSQVRVQSHDRWRLLLANGAIVDCLDDGSWSLWGHDQDALRAALGPLDEVPALPVDAPIVIERARATADAAADRIRVELKAVSNQARPPSRMLSSSASRSRGSLHWICPRPPTGRACAARASSWGVTLRHGRGGSDEGRRKMRRRSAMCFAWATLDARSLKLMLGPSPRPSRRI